MKNHIAPQNKIETIAIVGLGYVGLPLAVHFSKHLKVIGFDISKEKIQQLKSGIDPTRDIGDKAIELAEITYTNDVAQLKEADVIIIAVPTPVDEHNVPDLSPLKSASKTAGANIKRGAIVVYESTVYPGATEEVCVPILQNESGLIYNKDFFVGYSPERINPGDHLHTLDKVVKVVSASTPEVAHQLKELYGRVVHAGIHVAPSIKVAEAEKIVENIQRDINIALINELTILFDRLGIDIHDVLTAASTKWNFHRYTPGLVGGHCIGVDPYYLTYKAVEVNYHPNIILSGRRINDRMHSFYAQKMIKELNKKGIASNNAKVVVLGLTFKENCADYRNSRAKHLIKELKNYGVEVYGADPWLDEEVIKSLGAKPLDVKELNSLKPDGVIIVVPHQEFLDIEFKETDVVLDIKGVFQRAYTRERNINEKSVNGFENHSEEMVLKSGNVNYINSSKESKS